MNTMFERDARFTALRVRELRAIAAAERRVQVDTEPRTVIDHPARPMRWSGSAISLAVLATFVRRAT